MDLLSEELGRLLLGARIGFDPHGLFATSGSPPRDRNLDPQVALAVYERIIDRLKSEAGVEDAAVVNFMPSGRAGIPTRIEVPGRTPASEDLATYITVSEGFLRTLRIPLVRGRWYTAAESDKPGDGVDQRGRRETVLAGPDAGQAAHDLSVVAGAGGLRARGAVGGHRRRGDVRQFGPESDPNPSVYVPLAAEPWAWVSVAVRVREQSPASAIALRRAALEAEPNMLPMGPGAPMTFSSVERACRRRSHRGGTCSDWWVRSARVRSCLRR